MERVFRASEPSICSYHLGRGLKLHKWSMAADRRRQQRIKTWPENAEMCTVGELVGQVPRNMKFAGHKRTQ
jgi:hypothetical protein